MLNFSSDYMQAAHPRILERIAAMNFQGNPGYGTDAYCDSAREKIRAACECPKAAVCFLVGGTQTNSTVLDALLGRCDGVVSAATGHISCHEAGAIESTGHKVLAIPGTPDGKLTAQAVEELAKAYEADENREHTVAPGAVYISHPTEYGALYTKAELTALRRVCDQYQMPLFLDGARLGYGLAARNTDVTLPVLAQLCDAFYIGGTKVGALFGEAVVFPDPKRAKGFFTLTKRHGALLAKGFLLGVQFDTLFTDGLYLAISKNAIDCAERLRAALAQKGRALAIDTPTNQIFLTVTDAEYRTIGEKAAVGFWEKTDDSHTTIRIATSWATTMEEVDALAALL